MRKDQTLDFTPDLQNPYPADGWKQLDSLEFLSNLTLIRIASRDVLSIPREAQYILGVNYNINYKLYGKKCFLTVPAGILTDLASVLKVARSYIGRVGPHLEAAIVHDYLYRVWRDLPDVKTTHDMKRFADTVMLVGMQAAGMTTKAALIHKTLQWFGGKAFFGAGMQPRYIDIDEVRNTGGDLPR
ncbi:MAG: DUF1353 domain-containing protein [Rhodospirillaceae bacterium]|nr:DUF1353 domain-containing protein [Rhodospirillaceae bacterium]